MLELVSALFAVSAFALTFALLRNVNVSVRTGKGPIARFLETRRRHAFEEKLPNALGVMSNALRAGFSIQQAFKSVAECGDEPIAGEFAILEQQLRLGMSFDEALASLAKRVGSDDFDLVVTALTISRKTGGNITEIFDKISETIRGRMKIGRKVRTMTAQGRLQGMVISAMPFFLAIILTAIKPEMMLPFFFSMVGVMATLVALALIALGWLIIRKIITIDV